MRTSSNQFLGERRSQKRFKRQVAVTCRVPAIPCPAVIEDVSRRGCRLRAAKGALPVGATIRFELPGTGPICGQVVWREEDQAGVAFEEELSPSAAVALGLERPKPAQEEVREQANMELSGNTLRRRIGC